jgi:DNA helicase-2/ATP-dependent DNA helicase PcrA
VLRLVPGLGPRSAQGLFEECARLGAGAPTLEALLSDELVQLCPPKGRAGFSALRTLLRQLDELRRTPGGLIRQLLDGGYREVLEAEHFSDAESRAQDLEQLAAYAAQYQELDTFLAEIALLNDFSAPAGSGGGAAPEERVVLSSVHQAKGLEWRAVFVVWLADGRFPMSRATREPDEEEEERRLFYVACTRARDELYLTHPLTADPAEGERVLLRPSRFITELPDGDQAPFERLEIQAEPA